MYARMYESIYVCAILCVHIQHTSAYMLLYSISQTHYILLYTGAVGIKEICEDLNGTSSLVDEGDGISVNLPIKWLILGPGEEIVAAIGQKYYYILYTFINMIIHRLLYIINL